MMSHFDIFLIVASFLVPLFLAIQLFTDKRKTISRSIMAHTQLFAAIVFLLLYFYLVEDYRIYIPLHSLHATFEFLLFPFLYIYVKSVVSPSFELIKKWPHLMPALIVLIGGTYIFYFYYDYNDILYFLTHNRRGVDLDPKYNLLVITRYISLGVMAFQGIFYSVSFFRLPAAYNDRLRSEFSNIENFSIDWINKYLVSIAIISAIGLILYAILPIEGMKQHLIVFIFACMSGYISRLGILSLRQNVITPDLDIILDKNDDCNNIKDPKLEMLLNEYMNDKKIFLQPDLNLTNFAKALGTNRTYLSAFINQRYGKNFNAYINDHRIEYVKELLQENPGLSRESLCQAAGFGSQSTLQRALNKLK